MIPVLPQTEYADFDVKVRQPGIAFLRVNPGPNSREFKKHEYWRKAASHLHAAYDKRCAYTTKRLVHTGSVDHFLPKSSHPHLAYEWDNYRLARQTINTRKGDRAIVVDPFMVQYGWFTLELPSCLIKAADELDRAQRVQINSTINSLQLNSDDRLVQERADLLVHLADGEISLAFLDNFYPFLSHEVRRQSVENDLEIIFARQSQNK